MTRVMVVDDDSEVSMALSNTLKLSHYEVDVYPDANLALESLKRRRPDLIMLDKMLPMKSGLDFLKELKRSVFQNIPVIMLSVSREQKDIDEALRSGAADFINKPFLPADLIVRVKKVLGETAGSADQSA